MIKNKNLYNKKYKTQKAKGILWLEKFHEKISYSAECFMQKHYVFTAKHRHNEGEWQFPVFVRPCPTVPKHGFVDSRICKNVGDLNQVHKETEKADPNGEVIVTKFVHQTKANMILANNRITYGPGNDGATSGKSCVTVPVVYDNYFTNFLSTIPSEIVDPKKEVPFFELIQNRSNYIYFTQLRSALKESKVNRLDYIPEDIKIEKVLAAEGDLVEWAEKIDSLSESDRKGLVVDHYGGSMSSHFSIHCILNGVPIITTFQPKVGQELGKNTEITISEKEASTTFYKAFEEAYTFDDPKLKDGKKIVGRLFEYTIYSLYALHNSVELMNQDRYDILGRACGLFCKMAFSLCVGESRYAKTGKKVNSDIAGRTDAYLKTCEIETSADRVKEAFKLFTELSWSSGFGGKKWASCLHSSSKLFDACIDKDYKRAIDLFNKAINEQHNNGLMVTKVDIHRFNHNMKMRFDFASSRTTWFSVEYMDIVYDIEKAFLEAKNSKVCKLEKFDLKLPVKKKKKPEPKKVDLTPYSIENITSPQIRIKGTNQTFRLQFNLNGSNVETDINFDFCYKQAPSVIKAYNGPLSKSLYSSTKYVPMEIEKGVTVKGWFTVNDKRIVKIDDVLKKVFSL